MNQLSALLVYLMLGGWVLGTASNNINERCGRDVKLTDATVVGVIILWAPLAVAAVVSDSKGYDCEDAK